MEKCTSLWDNITKMYYTKILTKSILKIVINKLLGVIQKYILEITIKKEIYKKKKSNFLIYNFLKFYLIMKFFIINFNKILINYSILFYKIIYYKIYSILFYKK